MGSGLADAVISHQMVGGTGAREAPCVHRMPRTDGLCSSPTLAPPAVSWAVGACLEPHSTHPRPLAWPGVAHLPRPRATAPLHLRLDLDLDLRRLTRHSCFGLVPCACLDLDPGRRSNAPCSSAGPLTDFSVVIIIHPPPAHNKVLEPVALFWALLGLLWPVRSRVEERWGELLLSPRGPRPGAALSTTGPAVNGRLHDQRTRNDAAVEQGEPPAFGRSLLPCLPRGVCVLWSRAGGHRRASSPPPPPPCVPPSSSAAPSDGFAPGAALPLFVPASFGVPLRATRLQAMRCDPRPPLGLCRRWGGGAHPGGRGQVLLLLLRLPRTPRGPARARASSLPAPNSPPFVPAPFCSCVRAGRARPRRSEAPAWPPAAR